MSSKTRTRASRSSTKHLGSLIDDCHLADTCAGVRRPPCRRYAGPALQPRFSLLLVAGGLGHVHRRAAFNTREAMTCSPTS